MNNKVIIKLENVSVIYNLGKPNEVKALDRISLEIFEKEYIIFFGPSGCGKSTLLYTIAGLQKPTYGKVWVANEYLDNLREKELVNFHQTTIGMVFQAFYLIPNLTVETNIELPAILSKTPKSKRRKRVLELMERFEIKDLAKKYPSQLSGGQQQRTAIARALVNNPKIILADEPVGNLDSKNAEIVLSLLEKLNTELGKTVIHVTHNPQHLKLAHRVFYLKDGKLIRVVKNPEKLKEAKPSILERLAQNFPHLSIYRLKAKLILNLLSSPFSLEESLRFEEKLEKYLKGYLPSKEILEFLDKPKEKGGLNLYSQTARQITLKILEINKIMHFLENLRTKREKLTPEILTKIEEFALGKISKKRLHPQQEERFSNFLLERLYGKITSREFKEKLDLSFEEGGVGLNKRSAERASRRIEALISLFE